jgi:hypothetical protein
MYGKGGLGIVYLGVVLIMFCDMVRGGMGGIGFV